MSRVLERLPLLEKPPVPGWQTVLERPPGPGWQPLRCPKRTLRGEAACGLSGRLQGDTDARSWGVSETIVGDMAAHAAWHAAAAAAAGG